jgi:DNA primase catalytic subunit
MKLKDLKKTHYESTTLLVPDIPRREISLGVNIRAQCFNKTKDLAKVLAARSNIEGAFASTAYYLDPHIKAHTKKGHLGTDLVFDVDAKPVSDRLNWLYDVCFKYSFNFVRSYGSCDLYV